MTKLPWLIKWAHSIRFTLRGDLGTYEAESLVSVVVSDERPTSFACYEFEGGQFRIGVLRSLLIDSRQTFADALEQDPTLPRLSNRVVLALTDTPPEADVREMLVDADRFGVELVFDFINKSSSD